MPPSLLITRHFNTLHNSCCRRTLGHSLHPANSPCLSGCWQGSAMPWPMHTQDSKPSKMACSTAPRNFCTVLNPASSWANLQPGALPCPDCRGCRALHSRGRHCESSSPCIARTGTCWRCLEGGLPQGSRLRGPSPGRWPSLQTPKPGHQQGRPSRDDVPRDAIATGKLARREASGQR